MYRPIIKLIVGWAEDLRNNNNIEIIKKGLHIAIRRVLSNLVIREKCVYMWSITPPILAKCYCVYSCDIVYQWNHVLVSDIVLLISYTLVWLFMLTFNKLPPFLTFLKNKYMHVSDIVSPYSVIIPFNDNNIYSFTLGSDFFLLVTRFFNTNTYSKWWKHFAH